MRRVLKALLSALLAAAQCVAIPALANGFELIRFPVFGGEDDFSLRTSWFLFWLFPAFLSFGLVIGCFKSLREIFLSAVGMTAGGVAAVAVVMLLQPTISLAPGAREANLAVAAYFAGWLVLSVMGSGVALALGGKRRARSASPP